ncbi:MAG: hypothetical protein F4Y27_08130 [Acidimicrobiaceae bacterium]|nr:hypothetical protein [Acidimicrobiaceae bacterium]MXW62402.1 hypothetical protein [Acidimicrobiaceae bacterium]MXW76431.1 hypothetical protein [Acidimicrobiaceae bacterium]MYA74628.1 hypothetical protein [Acidimicrobiaceae bacterium]MYC41461.1 hypothetical protein [Acidimicrobiaceae bacterium]
MNDSRRAIEAHDELPDEYDPEFDANYVPDGTHTSKERRKELKSSTNSTRRTFEEVGEPTPEEAARSEAWWRPIREHLAQDLGS